MSGTAIASVSGCTLKESNNTGDGLLVSLDGGGTFGLSDIAGLPESGKIVSFAGVRHGDSVRLFALVRKENAWSGMNAKDVYQAYQDVYVLNWGKYQ